MKWINTVPIAQRNPKWANVKLGHSNLTIGGYGCLVTSMGMVAGVTPDVLNAAMQKNGGFSGALVATFDVKRFIPSAPKFVRATSKYATVPFPSEEIDYLIQHLRSDKPAIIEVDMNISTPQQDQHFVLGVGAFGFGDGREIVMNDPWYEDQTTICPRYYKTLGRALIRAIYYEG